MSFEAMAWAVKQETANSGQKLVLLLLANHANGHTGQCNPSQNLLAIECCMGLSTLRRHIAELEILGFLSVIHVFTENFKRPNQYVLKITTSSQNCTIDHPNRREGTSILEEGVPPNRMIKQEVKPVKETNTVISINSAMFERFWIAYPRKTNKGFARTVFGKIKPNEEMLQKMISAIDKQKRSDQWKDPKYIPHPSSWLNGERWEDEESTGKPSFNPLAGAI